MGEQWVFIRINVHVEQQQPPFVGKQVHFVEGLSYKQQPPFVEGLSYKIPRSPCNSWPYRTPAAPQGSPVMSLPRDVNTLVGNSGVYWGKVGLNWELHLRF